MHVVQHRLTMSSAIVLSGVTSGFLSVKTRFNCSAWLMRSIRSLHSTQYTLHRAAVTDYVRTDWCGRISDWLSDASSLNNAACVTGRNYDDADNNDDKYREITAQHEYSSSSYRAIHLLSVRGKVFFYILSAPVKTLLTMQSLKTSAVKSEDPQWTLSSHSASLSEITANCFLWPMLT